MDCIAPALQDPWQESERLAALHRYGILDTPPEQAYDDIVRMVAGLLDAPVAALSFIDGGRQWFKAQLGLGVREMPVDDPACRHAILSGALVIPDTACDERLYGNPLVTGGEGLRFYVSEPLTTPDGFPIGALCVLAPAPRPQGLSDQERFMLRTLAQQVMCRLELQRAWLERQRMAENQRQIELALRAERDRSQQLLEGMDETFLFLDRDFRVQQINAGALRMDSRPAEQLIGRTHWELWPESHDSPAGIAYRRALAENVSVNLEELAVLPEGRTLWLDIRAYPAGDGLAIFCRDISARKCAEIQLIESKEQVEKIVHQAAAGVVQTDVHGRFTVVNDTFCAMVGYTRDELLRMSVADVTAADSQAGTMHAIGSARAGGSSFVLDKRYRRKDGSLVWATASVNALKGAGGEFQGLVAIIVDVTEKKRTEAALRVSEQRFRSLIMATAQMVWTTTPDGYTVEDAPSWRAFTGQTEQEWLGAGWLDAIHPHDRAGAHAAWRDAMAGRRAYETEYRLRRADGAYRWTVARAVPVLGEDGSIREWVGINIDIHDRKQAECALRDAQARLEATLVAGEVATWTWHIQADQVHADRNLARLFAVSEADAHGGPLAAYMAAVHPDDAPMVSSAVQDAIRTGEHYGVEYRVKPAHGSDAGGYRWVVARGKVEFADDGTPERLAGVALDITEQKLAEEELRRLASDLSEVNRRKTEFLATLAHELRNPLAPIRNGLEVLRLAGAQGASTAKVLDMMQRQIKHMVHLIDDLLDVARISSGKIELKKERIDLRAVVNNAVEASMPAIEAGAHRLAVHLPPDAVWLDADPVRIAQVLNNLLTNAAKYTPEGGLIELTARLDGGRVVIAVSDNGIGIAEHELPTVFDLFTQVGRNLGRAQGGLGIGLSLVKQLVDMHGGAISAHSGGERRGSTFVVHLPCTAGLAPRRADDTVPALDAPRAAGQLSIVVADDNVDAADSLAALLQACGHAVAVGYDGQEALRLIRERRPDVAIVDIGMPGLTGYEVARVVRKAAELERTVMVALTGWGATDDRARAREAGFDHHLTKPVQLDTVQRLLTQLDGAAHQYAL